MAPAKSVDGGTCVVAQSQPNKRETANRFARGRRIHSSRPQPFAPSSRSFAPPSLCPLPPSLLPPIPFPSFLILILAVTSSSSSPSFSSSLLPYLHSGPSSSAINVSHHRWNKKHYACLPLKEEKGKQTILHSTGSNGRLPAKDFIQESLSLLAPLGDLFNTLLLIFTVSVNVPDCNKLLIACSWTFSIGPVLDQSSVCYYPLLGHCHPLLSKSWIEETL